MRNKLNAWALCALLLPALAFAGAYEKDVTAASIGAVSGRGNGTTDVLAVWEDPDSIGIRSLVAPPLVSNQQELHTTSGNDFILRAGDGTDAGEKLILQASDGSTQMEVATSTLIVHGDFAPTPAGHIVYNLNKTGSLSEEFRIEDVTRGLSSIFRYFDDGGDSALAIGLDLDGVEVGSESGYGIFQGVAGALDIASGYVALQFNIDGATEFYIQDENTSSRIFSFDGATGLYELATFGVFTLTADGDATFESASGSATIRGDSGVALETNGDLDGEVGGGLAFEIQQDASFTVNLGGSPTQGFGVLDGTSGESLFSVIPQYRWLSVNVSGAVPPASGEAHVGVDPADGKLKYRQATSDGGALFDLTAIGSGTDNHAMRWNGTEAAQDSDLVIEDVAASNVDVHSTSGNDLTFRAGTGVDGGETMRFEASDGSEAMAIATGSARVTMRDKLSVEDDASPGDTMTMEYEDGGFISLNGMVDNERRISVGFGAGYSEVGFGTFFKPYGNMFGFNVGGNSLWAGDLPTFDAQTIQWTHASFGPLQPAGVFIVNGDWVPADSAFGPYNLGSKSFVGSGGGCQWDNAYVKNFSGGDLHNTLISSELTRQVLVEAPKGTLRAQFDVTTGNTLLRNGLTTSAGGLQSSTGTNRFYWSESESTLRFGNSGPGVTVHDPTGGTYLRGKSDGTGGVFLQDKDSTVNMIAVDQSAAGEVILRAKGSGDFVGIYDGLFLPRLLATDNQTLIYSYNSEWSLITDGINGTITLRGAPSGSNPAVVINDAANTVNMLLADYQQLGELYLRPVAVGDFLILRDGQAIDRVQVTDASVADGYEVSLKGDVKTTGVLDVADALLVRGDAFTSAASYNANIRDPYVYCDLTSNNIVVNLPAAASSRGAFFDIKLDTFVAARTVTVDASGLETIDGSLTYTLTLDKETVRIRMPSSGTDWKVH